MTPIRVVLATMPPLLGDIVRATLARDPDVEILAEVASHDAIAPAVDRSDADVAILGTIASVGARLIEGTANKLITQAFDCMRAKLEA